MKENIDTATASNNDALQVKIDWNLYKELKRLGIIYDCKDEVDIRSFNIGKSNYSKHLIQPWSIWIDWNLNAFDADIVKRVLRTKEGESRVQDYEKIIHICNERIRQLNEDRNTKNDILD